MSTQILYEATSLSLALAAGIYAYPYMNKFIRALFFQLVVWVFFYLSAYALTIYQEMHHLTKNNSVVFNLAVPLEFLILTTAAFYFFTDKLSRYLVISSYGIFLLSIGLQMKFFRLGGFLNYATASGYIIMTAIFIMILYKKLKTNSESWNRSPEVWASLGLVLYFACNVPYVSIMPYLNDNSPEQSKSLFNYITDNLANIRYLLLAMAFWLVRKNRSAPFTNIAS